MTNKPPQSKTKLALTKLKPAKIAKLACGEYAVKYKTAGGLRK